MENTDTAKYSLATALYIMIERGMITKEQVQQCETHFQLQTMLSSIDRDDYVLRLLNDLDNPLL